MNKVQLKKLIENHFGYAEAVKNLRTNVQFSGNDVKLVALTSSLPGEGKSDTAYALAMSFSQMGKRTVFVDADIRKSVLMSRLEVSEKVAGLSEYLTGQCTKEEIICETNYDNLNVIFAGSYSANASELLEEDLFTELLAALKSEYDMVIIDTPPLGVVTDCAIIAKSCDGVVLVIESGAISYHLLQKVKRQLEATGSRILGVVLNKVSQDTEGYYGKYGKYGKYGQYKKYEKYSSYSSEKETAAKR